MIKFQEVKAGKNVHFQIMFVPSEEAGVLNASAMLYGREEVEYAKNKFVNAQFRDTIESTEGFPIVEMRWGPWVEA